MPELQTDILTPAALAARFDSALPYADYVATGTEEQQAAWRKIYEQAALTAAQTQLVRGFAREMKVLVSSGIWCGDCSQQLPLLERIAEVSPEIRLARERRHEMPPHRLIDVRYFDRDADLELAERLKICGGLRVPIAIFMAEDFEPVSIFGDRTLTRYRAIAARQIGAACPVPGAPVPADELAGTLQDWLDEVERVHLVLRLSGRLRKKHGD